MTHQIHIWQLVLRHPDAFYPYRRELVPNGVPMLVRLGMHQTATLEHKRLSLDLVALVLQWEARVRAGGVALAATGMCGCGKVGGATGRSGFAPEREESLGAVRWRCCFSGSMGGVCTCGATPAAPGY